MEKRYHFINKNGTRTTTVVWTPEGWLVTHAIVLMYGGSPAAAISMRNVADFPHMCDPKSFVIFEEE